MKVDGKERLLEDWHREILKGFYSVFKSADEDLQFVLLTGVTKFSQVSVFSGFNQPSDISMDEQYETLCGITQEELEHYFAGPIEALAEKYRTTPEGMKMMLKHRYDGYHFSSNLTDVYNPFSLLNAFAKRGTARLLVLQRHAHLPHPADEPYAGRPERTDRTLLPARGVRRLQGGRGTAAPDDLPKRLPDRQGL